jgi:hypothetical protein
VVKPLGPGPDEFDELDIEIIDRYLGSNAIDPEVGKNGQLSQPTRKVMVAELEVYVDDGSG